MHALLQPLVESLDLNLVIVTVFLSTCTHLHALAGIMCASRTVIIAIHCTHDG